MHEPSNHNTFLLMKYFYKKSNNYFMQDCTHCYFQQKHHIKDDARLKQVSK